MSEDIVYSEVVFVNKDDPDECHLGEYSVSGVFKLIFAFQSVYLFLQWYSLI